MPTSPAPTAPAASVVYQLKVVLRGVSPMIWRRLLVRSDSTIADLHATLQLAMAWSEEHLHRFVIHGKDYGISRIGGLGFSDDPHRVQLADFGVRLRERFL
jgi:Plasmid pRiA4b ORF-3-like protein